MSQANVVTMLKEDTTFRKRNFVASTLFLLGMVFVSAFFAWSVSAAVPAGPGAQGGQNCPANWRIVPSTNPHIHNQLLAIEPVTASDVWAVGYYYESTQGQAPDTALIMHWDGTQWSEYALPNPIVGRLNGISRVSANDIWAVGWTNESGTDTETLVLHWNGIEWSRVPSPTVEGISELNDVTALASDDVWAVGSVNGTHGTLVEHWNGAYWAIVPSPPVSFGDNYILTEISAVSPSDIWAVGFIDQGSGFQQTLIEHWNGSQWSIVPSPNPGSYYSRLDGVVALAADDVWAVGSYSTNADRTLIMHWDGAQWSVVPSPSPGVFYNDLRDISASSAGDIWAVGVTNDALQAPDYTLIERWDGTQWSVVPSPNGPRVDNSLWGVTARDGVVWAVGKGENKFDNYQPWDTLVLRQTCPATPTVTGTPPTATTTSTSTAIATPTACNPSNTNYTISTQSAATVVPATTDIGLHCDNCAQSIALPFSFALYGQNFTSVIAGSNGTLGFVANSNTWRTACLPSQEFNYAILPYWQELHLSNVGGGCPDCGIFTSVEGSAPNRIFNIEWRARDYFYTSVVNVEVRLREGNPDFEVIYGTVPSGTNQQVTVGVQKERGLLYTQYVCDNVYGTIANGTKLTFSQPSCGIGTATTTATTSTATSVASTSTSTLTATSVIATSTTQPTQTVATPAPSRTATLSPTNTAPVPSVTRTGTATAGPTNTPGGPTETATETSVPTATATSTPTACAITFIDVPPDSTFYPFIRCLACRGIISGYSDGTFRPQNDITRGQIAKMVSNSAGFQEDPGPQIYEDVAPGSPFYDYINRLSNRGYMGGYPCGLVPEEPCIPPANLPYFRPSANATRGQLSKIVANAAQVGGTPTGIFYTDVPEGHPFYLWVMRLTELGVMSGYPCGGVNEPCDEQQRPYFRPYNNVTRGQASKIVANTFFPSCVTPAR